MPKKMKSLVIVNTKSLTLIGGPLVKFEFPQNCVSDMEITDLQGLESSLKEFIEGKNLGEHLVIILTEDLTFQKILSQEQIQLGLKQKFLESIPFDKISFHTFPTDKGENIVAVNRNFYEGLKTIFEKLGFNVEAVVLETSLPQKYQKLSDPTILANVVKKVDFTTLNLVGFYRQEKRVQVVAQQIEKSKNLKFLIPLIGLAVLILIGSILYSASTTKNRVAASPLPSAQPTSQNESERLVIKIVYQAEAEDTAKRLQNSLWNEGFKSTETVKATSRETSTKLVIPQGLSLETEQKIKRQLEKIGVAFQTEKTEQNITGIIILLTNFAAKMTP